MKAFKANEKFFCSICEEKYYTNQECIPICLKCGHTICKSCLNRMLKMRNDVCPICKNKREILNENIIIRKIIQIIHLPSFNYKSLLKLDFIYCSNCDKFLSKFSSEVHYTLNHILQPISKYTFDWFESLAKNSHRESNYMIKIFFVLYFFQSPYIIKMKDYIIKEKLLCNKNNFTFFGENYINSNNLNKGDNYLYQLFKLTLNPQLNNDNKLYIKKGIVIGRNRQIIHGYFLFYITNEINIIKGFGLINYEKKVFFGFINFIYQSSIIKSGFSLDVGILANNNKSIFFGEFSHHQNDFPDFEIENGEILKISNNLISNVIQVDYNKDYLNNEEDHYESFDNNQYFKYKNNNNLDKILFLQKFIHSKNDVKVEIAITQSNKKISYVKIIKNNEKSNNIIIYPLINYENSLDEYLFNCQIFLKNYKISIVLNFDKDGFILSNDFSSERNFNGYLIKENKKSNDNIYSKFTNLKMRNALNSVDSIINFVEKLINSKLNNFDISFRNFNHLLQNEKNTNYVIIDANKLNFLYCSSKTKVLKTFSFPKLKDLTIKDIFPTIYYSKYFGDCKEIISFTVRNNNNRNKGCCCIF